MAGKINSRKENISNLCFNCGRGLTFSWLGQLGMKLRDFLL